MKYDLRREFRIFRFIRMPVRPGVLRIANRMMPVIQRGRTLFPRELSKEQVSLPDCTATVWSPVQGPAGRAMLYCHGGAFALRAAAYHKNLVQEYARGAGCALVFPDYRLAPDHPFPQGLVDCMQAYRWMLDRFSPQEILVGGDSAGAALALGVWNLARAQGLPTPGRLMLVYPVLDARMTTRSMEVYRDTPLWNSVLNRKMWDLYAPTRLREHPLVSPAALKEVGDLPPTYVETAQYDCLHDEGVLFAQRLAQAGVPVTQNETTGTMHGYDIAWGTPYVRAQVARRIAFLSGKPES